MKKARKGFTLVELLIVVAILATLTATMMVSMRGATAKAKATSIAANLESCHTAAMLYYAASGDKDLSSITAENMLKVNLKTWENLKGDNSDTATVKDAIVYTAVGSGVENWSVNVDFSGDSEAADIAKALNNMRGYSGITAFAGNDFDMAGFDFFGATPAYADDEPTLGGGETTPGDATPANANAGKLFMNLITGKIYAGSTTDGIITEDDNTQDLGD